MRLAVGSTVLVDENAGLLLRQIVLLFVVTGRIPFVVKHTIAVLSLHPSEPRTVALHLGRVKVVEYKLCPSSRQRLRHGLGLSHPCSLYHARAAEALAQLVVKLGVAAGDTGAMGERDTFKQAAKRALRRTLGSQES
jgi:hypothetical protein